MFSIVRRHRDFFISYNARDRQYAEWIAFILEQEGFTTTIQSWDFVGNWIMKMHRAMKETTKTIAVLSPHYVNALFTQAEWMDAYRRDPTGEKDILIPIKIAPFDPDGILAQVVYIDFVGQSEEECRVRLLNRIRGERGKPLTKPIFPTRWRRRTIRFKSEFPDQLPYVRKMITRFNEKYTGREDMLHVAYETALKLSCAPPLRINRQIIEIISLADSTASDLASLPLGNLKRADIYIHESVIKGEARIAAHRCTVYYTNQKSETQEERQRRKALKLPELPNSYEFEQIARVLHAAWVIVNTNIEVEQ